MHRHAWSLVCKATCHTNELCMQHARIKGSRLAQQPGPHPDVADVAVQPIWPTSPAALACRPEALESFGKIGDSFRSSTYQQPGAPLALVLADRDRVETGL